MKTVPRAAGSAERRSGPGSPASPMIMLADQRVAAFQAVVGSTARSPAPPFPCWYGGEPVGVMIFHVAGQGTFTPELVELLQRLADNVSFALENFDRADEKARTEEQKERLTRMFAALSATNEAIMRAAPGRSCSNWCARPRRTAASSPRPPSHWSSPAAIFSTSSRRPARPPRARGM